MPRRMLLSVSDKNGLAEFAGTMQHEFGFELFASDGTGELLEKAGLKVTKIEDYTGFPEMMGKRVKTLHPKVHGGILRRPEDKAIMEEHGILEFDLVVVNFYPFSEMLRQGKSFAEMLNTIDVGGPTLACGPGKNFGLCAPIVEPELYGQVIEEFRAYGKLSVTMRLQLGAAALQAVSDFYGEVADFYRSSPVETAEAFMRELEAKMAA